MIQGRKTKIVAISVALRLILPSLVLAGSPERVPQNEITSKILKEMDYRVLQDGSLEGINYWTLSISKKNLEKNNIFFDETGLIVDQRGAWIPEEEVTSRIMAITPEVAWAPESFEMHEGTAKALKEAGFSYDDKGTLVHKKTGAVIQRETLKKADLDYDVSGEIVYRTRQDKFWQKDENGKPFEGAREIGASIEDAHLTRVLNSLLEFDAVAKLDSKLVGKTLQEWRVPPAFDGVRLLNADGSATYYGAMLYKGLQKNPTFGERLLQGIGIKTETKNASPMDALTGEQLSKALTNFRAAHQYAFNEPYARASSNILKEGIAALRAKPDVNGTPVPLAPENLMSLAALRRAAEAAKAMTQDNAYKTELEQTIDTLNTLEKQYHHKEMSLTDVPAPAIAEPAHTTLPSLLKTLDRVMGKPLSDKQKEALVENMPMGQTISRMKAYKFWEKGLTGKGIKIAVIDSGVGANEELHDALNSRKDFINRAPRPRAPQPGLHGTHVAGTIRALAPDAEINSYDVFDDAGSGDKRILAAVDAAVADGNQIINMSLGGMGTPSSDFVKHIEAHKKNGVTFFISAGNSADDHGIGSPSIAENAITVGALDVNERMARFSSYGRVYDPDRLAYLYKPIYMAPGTNIVSTTGLDGEEKKFTPLNGTSMAAPHATGAGALLMQHVQATAGGLNPVTLSERFQNALKNSSQEMDRTRMPANLPKEQKVSILDFWAAAKNFSL